MERRFLLNGQEVEVLIAPTLTETLNESLDNFTVVLKANTQRQPYAPTQSFLVQEKENNEWKTILYFVVDGDQVDVFSSNPLTYTHKLTLIQKSQLQTKHLIRNTSFTTSLEGSSFKTYASSLVKAIDLNFDEFIYSGENVKGYISCGNREVKKITVNASWWIQIIKGTSLDADYSSGLTKYTLECKRDETKNWADIYRDNTVINTLPTEIKNRYLRLPRLYFNHYDENGTLTDYRIFWTTDETVIINGVDFQLPQNIIDWINTFDYGYIEIEIENYVNTTFIYPDGWSALVDKASPILTNLRYVFSVESVENSVYDVIDELLTQHAKNSERYTHEKLFKLPTEETNKELYDLLKNTSSPNFVFTQSTMYDALAEIFKLFDAIFYIDEENYLGIEYYNEQNQIQLNENKIVGINSSLSSERYNNKIVSFYQNSKVKMKFPNSNDSNSFANVRSKSLGVPGANDYVFMLPKPIDIITKCEIEMSVSSTKILWYSSSAGSSTISYYIVPEIPNLTSLDITENVVESSIYSILDKSSSLPIKGNWNNIGQYNTLSYTKGNNYIDLAGIYTTTTNTKKTIIENVIKSCLAKNFGSGITSLFTFNYPQWDKIRLRVEYIALTNGKLEIESFENKFNGSMLMNQGNGSIDINKLGLNMVGTSMKLGQPTLSMTYKFSKWADRIKKGQFFIKDNEKWVADTCNYTFLNNGLIQSTIQFVKNFNGLSSRIQLNQEKRLSNISNELTVVAEDTYGEYIYYSSKPITQREQITVFSSTNKYFIANYTSTTFGVYTSRYKVREVPFSQITFNSSTLQDMLDTESLANGLYNVSCVVQSIDNEKITLGTAASGGKSITVSFSGAVNCVEYDVLKGQFYLNQSYIGVYSFQGGRTLQAGSNISVSLIVYNDVITGCALKSVVELGTLYNSAWNNSAYIPYYVNEYSNRVEYATITPLTASNKLYKNNGIARSNIVVPLYVYGSGNSVCFEMLMDNPISAGNQLLTNYDGMWSGEYFSRAVLYTDNEGRAEKFDINFVKLLEPLTEFFPELKKGDYDDPEDLETFTIGSLKKYHYCKKPNEIFGLNYQIHYLPLEDRIHDDFLSNEFIKNNGFSNSINKEEFSLYYSTDNFKYSILDIKGEGNQTPITSITSEILENGWKITFNYNTIPQDIKSWSICDSKGNIYYASNESVGENSSSVSIYFISRHYRL